MALWRWLTGRLSVTEGIEKWRSIAGTDYDTLENVSANGALKLSAWWSAVRLISETIATLPLGIYQKKGDNREALDGHFLYDLLHDRPNSDQTPVEFWEGRIAPLCTHGNSFSEKKYIGNRLVSLLPLPVEQISVYRNDKNNIEYKFYDRGKTYILPQDKVFHIKGFAPNDEDVGLSPVEYAARSVGASLATERAAARVYSRGLRAQGYFVAPEEMNSDQRNSFIKNYVEKGEGAKAEGGTIILPPKFDWKTFNITPRDAEMVLSRGVNVEDICRWMGVPPILIGHSGAGQTMWGSGVEQIILGWLVLGLRAKLKRIESAVNFRLMPVADAKNGIYFEFNFEGLLRADSAARASLMSTLAQNGLRTRNELRKIDNYKTVDGGDDLTVQSNLVPLDKLGEAPPDQKQSEQADQIRQIVRTYLIDERKAA